MKVCGIIAEYNPFHNGHAYQIRYAKEKLGADYIVVCMSGDFVQRGAPAVLNKYERTRMAIESGADLVLEMPAANAVSSAEFFASGGVSLLERQEPSEIFRLYPKLTVLNSVTGALMIVWCLGLAVSTVRLARFKKGAPETLTMMLGLYPLLPLGYTAAFSLATGGALFRIAWRKLSHRAIAKRRHHQHRRSLLRRPQGAV